MKRLLIYIYAVIILIAINACQESNNNPVNTNNSNTDSVTNQQLLDEINYARVHPAEYANILKDMRKYFNGLRYEEPGQPILITQEGVAAVDEAIQFLQNQASINSLVLSNALCKSARDHVNDTGPKGIVSHTGSDGSSPTDRMGRYGQNILNANRGENIAFGPNTARKITAGLIIDDGVSDRGHRINIFNTLYTKVGFAFGYHSVYKYMCVSDFTDNAYKE